MSGQLKEFKQPNSDDGETFPLFSKPPSDGVAHEGDRLEFRCTVEGNPPPKVAWRKGQWLQIDNSARYGVTRNTETGICTMAIKSVRSTDVGKYKIVITNDFGERSFPFSVKVDKSKKDDSVKNFKTQLKHREVKKVQKKTAEEKEKEILEILKKADPKDYEKICMAHGFYDFRMILRKLGEMTKVDIPAAECEAAKVLKELRHVTVNDEGTAVFEMHMENVAPDKHMMWFKDGELILVPGPEKRHELRRIGNVFQLIIRNANADDAGTYTLDIGGHKFDAVLTIKEQILKFGTELKNQSAKVKGRCVFECVLTRRGQRVTWYKDGQAVNLRGSTARIQSVTEAKTHKLILTELELKDAGKYTAKVGDLESSAELKVALAPVKFRHRLTNTEVKEKNSAVFECSVNTKDIKPVWTVNGQVVQNAGRYAIKTGDVHSLTIKRVALTDHQAVVKVSFSETTSSAELQVVAKPIKLISKMKNVKCRSGEPVEFSCEIDDLDADAQVEWFKDDKPIKASSKYEMKKIKGKYTLKLKSVVAEDEGMYQFQIRGVRSEANLYCTDPPMVDKEFMENLKKNPLKFKAGSKAKIAIPFAGRPPLTVAWTNGRVSLDSRGRFEMSNTDKMAVLTVDKCKVTDAGTYELDIVNENGEVKVEIPVKILAKPDAPSGEIAMSDVGKNSATFSWNPPIDDMIPIDDYVIEVKDKSGKWKKLAKVPRDTTSYTATNLNEGEEYQFRVKSSNEEGESEPLESKVITPIAPDEPPFIDPKVIQELENTPIIVKAGETATIRVPCKGNPPPSASWLHDKEEILPVKHHRATKTQSMNEVALKISKCQLSDSGVYEARIFNNVGGVALKTNIIVKDVPAFSETPITFDNVAPTEVGMSWKPPTEDGGSPIDAYVIERSVAGKNKWEKVGEADAASTNFTCKGCEPEVEYVFRVKALNKQGESQPAVSAPVTCGVEMVKPTVDEEVMRSLAKHPIRVKAGQTGRLRIPIKGGQPPPTVTWEKDGEPLKEDGKRVVANHNDAKNASVILHKCVKSDTGKYVCKIKNDAGVVEVPMELQIVDVPEAPQGPIDFSDISAKGATLSWAPTHDDGGSAVTHYVIEKKEENRKVWTAVGKTKDGATTTFRAGVPPGKTYKFRIRAVSEVGESASNESQPVTIKDPYDPPSAVSGEVEMEEATNDSITVSWDKVKSDGGSAVTGYYIEKRKKGTSSWTRCNPNQLCQDRMYKAENLRTDMEYEFRVIAVNAAGESDPSRPSKLIAACDPVAPPGVASDLELIDSTNSSLSFSWKGTNEVGGADLLGYDIELMKDGTNKWMKYNDSHITGTSYTVRGLEHGAAYHVRLRTANMRSHSKYYRYSGTFLAQEFHVAPAFKMTSELEAVVRNGFTINAGGTIRIHVPYHARPRPVVHWTKNSGELEDHVNVEDTDGVSQLTIRNARGFHSGTYKVVLKNASGSQSLTVKVSVVDVPSPPKGPLQVIVKENEILLRWQPAMHDGGNEVLGYTIQKREARGRDWSTVAQNIEQCSYTITDLRKQRSYYLRVQAENNLGKSEPLQTKEMVYIKQHVEKVQIEDIQYDEKDLRKPPIVTVPLKPRNVPEGVKVTLSCSVSGKPHPVMRWYKDDREVTEDNHYYKENVIGLCRLVLTHAKVSDSGVYKVVAENDVGIASSEANVNVSN